MSTRHRKNNTSYAVQYRKSTFTFWQQLESRKRSLFAAIPNALASLGQLGRDEATQNFVWRKAMHGGKGSVIPKENVNVQAMGGKSVAMDVAGAETR